MNPIDWKIRQGKVRLVYPIEFPAIPGFDFCGTVLACGGDVISPEPGDRVCGMSNRRAGGSLAEELICSATSVARTPDRIGSEEAAGLPLAGLTALQGLRDHGRLKSGMRVLVVGASGGVGHLAVQLAVLRGGSVTAVCGPDNIDWVGRLGAEKTIDYRQPGWLRKLGKFDLILDAVGALGFGRSRGSMERGGSYVTTLPGPGIFFDQFIRAPLSRRRAATFLTKPSSIDLAELLEAWNDGNLKIRIDRVYDWSEFGAAFSHSESGRAKGKIVLRIPAGTEERAH